MQTNPFIKFAILTSVAIFGSALALPAEAVTLDIFGTPGINGVDGVGALGTEGGPGGAAGSRSRPAGPASRTRSANASKRE